MFSAPSISTAQVTTDISSSGLDTHVNHVGNSYDITGGTRPGGGPNLFHSFGNFSVGTGDTANFLNDSGLATSNILGRVTGGTISQIYGTIQTNGPGGFGTANLFLMNPSGIVLGPGASLNVGGSVSFTTAQYIRLFDGIGNLNFYADPANDGLLNSILTIDPGAFSFLSAQPAAYGFLTTPDPSATITVQGSVLSVPSGQSISLVGGKVLIEGGAQLSAPSGKILLATAASPGEFDVNTLQPLPNIDGASFTSFGTVSMASGSSIDAHDTGTVWIKGGQLVISVNDATLNTSASDAPANTISLSLGSSIVTANAGADPGADVQLTASNVQLDGASIQSTTTGSGTGGNITINGDTVSLLNGAQIVSGTSGSGDGGNITIAATNTPDSSVTVSGYDSTFTLSGVLNPFAGLITSGVYSTASAGGNGGQISITAPNVTLDDGAMLATLNTGSGVGGNISINSNTVTVGPTNTAFLLSLTGFDLNAGPLDSGNGGNITIHGLSGAPNSAAETVMISNGSPIYSITGGPNSGQGGDIVITSESVQLDTGASINSGLSGIGDGGNITMSVNSLSISNFAAINSWNDLATLGPGGSTTVQGLPGALNNAAELVTLGNFGNITSQSSASGQGGNIVITSQAVQLDTGASINSNTTGEFGNHGGDITLNVNTLALNGDGTTILSMTSSWQFGPGGDITIQGLPGALNNAAKLVTLSNGGRVATEAHAPDYGGVPPVNPPINPDGGHLAIRTSSLLMDNAPISSITDSTGRGGDILLSVGDAVLLHGAKITSSTSLDAAPDAIPAGGGGTVTVQGLSVDNPLAESLAISGNSGLTSTALGSGSLGNINVHAKTVTLADTGVIQVGTRQDTGREAGNVTIEANSVTLSGESSILSQVFAADAGQVAISATQLTMNNSRIETSTYGIGKAGDVVLNVGSINLANGSTISSSSLSTDPGAGDAGTVTIQGQGQTTPANAVTITDSSVTTSTAGSGTGGTITLQAAAINLNNSAISASTSGSGDAGTIGILATGNGVSLSRGSSIASSTTGEGNAGQVIVTTPALAMDHATITTSTNSTGNAGGITAKVGTLTMTNGAEISSSSTGTATGSAGSITMEGLASPATAVTITDSALLTTAEHTGRGGSITVEATTLALNHATISASVKNVNTADTGDGPAVGTGNISLSAQTVTMDGSHITAESLGTRNAGNISINSKAAPGKNFEMSNSQITTSATLADGGNIEIHATDMIRLTDSTITSSVGNETLSSTKGGNITIDPDYVILQRSEIRANAFAGTGGAIDITAGLFLADASSVVDASSTLGVSGTVQINAPINNLSSVVARLPESLLAVHTLLRAACTARLAQGETSSFVERGRDSIPAGPDGLLASPYLPMPSGGAARLRTQPSIEISGIQLRRLPWKESLPSVMLLSENAACSS